MNKAVWLKVELQHPAETSAPKYLVFDSPLLDRVDLCLMQGEQILQQRQHRLTLPVAFRAVDHRQIILPIELPAASDTTL